MYADHAENKISKLQETYSREYLPQEYTRSTKDSQRAQDVPAKSFGGKMAARGWREGVQEHEPSKPAPSTEGIVINVYGFQLGLPNWIP